MLVLKISILILLCLIYLFLASTSIDTNTNNEINFESDNETSYIVVETYYLRTKEMIGSSKNNKPLLISGKNKIRIIATIKDSLTANYLDYKNHYNQFSLRNEYSDSVSRFEIVDLTNKNKVHYVLDLLLTAIITLIVIIIALLIRKP
jgi:predicted nuclease of restriction endonuclease-like (RecB) superfamily